MKIGKLKDCLDISKYNYLDIFYIYLYILFGYIYLFIYYIKIEEDWKIEGLFKYIYLLY